MRLHSFVLSALAATLLAAPLAAQLPTDIRELASALQSARAPADLTAAQRAQLDQLIAALRASRRSLSPATRARFQEFAAAYFHRGEQAKLTQVLLHVFRTGAVAPDAATTRAVGMLARGETAAEPATTTSYEQAVQTIAGMMWQMYDDGMKILNNLKS